MSPLLQLSLGFTLGIGIAWLGWRLQALSVSGAVAAALIGGLIFGLGGLHWAVLLLLFFITSSSLSRLFGRRKASLAEKFSKGSQRDWGQVAANGGLGALLALAHGLWPDAEPLQAGLWLAYAGAMAAVNADTWGTELGVLSRTLPRLITNGRSVEHGTSGGISLAGTLASLGGAALVGLAAGGLQPDYGFDSILLAVSLGGFAGSLFDSWLGATIQAIYTCPRCQKETERHPYHTCGSRTLLQRGWRWLNNDLVNLACSLLGAGLAACIWLLIH